MRRLVTPGWLACHALTAVLVAGCLGLGWWQLDRAAGGNTLSWAYTVQWPVFAGFVVFIWVREIRRVLGHDEPTPVARASGEPARRPVLTRRSAPVVDDHDDPQLAAYNHYLAWLNANPGARRGDYPGAGQAVPGQTAAAQVAAGQTPAAQRVARKTAAAQIVAGQTVEEETWAQPSSGTA
jgi:hypothetical protein